MMKAPKRPSMQLKAFLEYHVMLHLSADSHSGEPEEQE
jgi:hypothetical protein